MSASASALLKVLRDAERPGEIVARSSRQNADSGSVIKLADAVDALMHSAVPA